MVKLLTQALTLGALLTLATACSKQDAPTPTGGSRTASANNVAPTDPPTGGGGGGGGGGGTSCTPSAPAQITKAQIKKKAQLICAGNGWTIVTTITPPDGFTFGIGCPTTSYPFSVDIIDENGHALYASGTYDCNTGTVTLSK